MGEIKELKTQFKLHLERLGYSKSSILMLPYCVDEFLSKQSINRLENIQPIQIQQHYEYLQQRPNKRKAGGLSESHINHHVYALKLFFKWLEASGKIQSNPISGLEFPSPKAKPREILSIEEIKMLYKECKTYRERAILSIYYGCGLRRTEGIKLDLKDVHFRTSLLYVREGKGAKRRVVPMSRKVKRDLQNYALKERKSIPGESSFLVGQRGKRINPGVITGALKSLLEKSSIERDLPAGKAGISLHSLRHSVATHLLESGLSIENVRDFLGHSFLESTQIYTKVSKEQIHKL